jgi:hypothetical protein
MTDLPRANPELDDEQRREFNDAIEHPGTMDHFARIPAVEDMPKPQPREDLDAAERMHVAQLEDMREFYGFAGERALDRALAFVMSWHRARRNRERVS